MTNKFFTYSSETGFEYSDTQKESFDKAQNILADWRSDACAEGEWSGYESSIMYGQVLGECRERDMGNGIVEYKIEKCGELSEAKKLLFNIYVLCSITNPDELKKAIVLQRIHDFLEKNND